MTLHCNMDQQFTSKPEFTKDIFGPGAETHDLPSLISRARHALIVRGISGTGIELSQVGSPGICEFPISAALYPTVLLEVEFALPAYGGLRPQSASGGGGGIEWMRILRRKTMQPSK